MPSGVCERLAEAVPLSNSLCEQLAETRAFWRGTRARGHAPDVLEPARCGPKLRGRAAAGSSQEHRT